MDFPPKTWITTVCRTQAACLVCTLCYRISPVALSKCSGCKRVVYCSKTCQSQDWKEHKSICKKLAKVNAYDAAKGHTLSDLSQRFEYFIAEQEARARIDLTGSPYQHPLVGMGVKCQVCFRTPFHDSEHTFSPCEDCKLAWWCSPKCRKLFKQYHSPDQCATLNTVRATDTVRIAYALSRQSIRSMMLCTYNPQKRHTPIARLKGWDDYFTDIMPEFDIHARHVAAEFTAVHPDAIRAVKLLAIESASIALTLLAALEKTIPDVGYRSRTTLCIHIIGAGSRETLCQGIMEEIMHYLPNLRTLTVAYVGPALPPNADDSDTRNVVCESCIPLGRRRFAIRRHMLYHDFVQSETYKSHPPDLVAGFNTGMGEVESDLWKPSIQYILDSNIPAVFTSYSRWEGLNDALFLTGLHAYFVLPVHKNIWCGLLPNPSEVSEHYGAEHFVNHFWQVIQGTTTS
ncbi:MYND-type domain-containing protein [Mycena indigotica]|uniref:MYND-type domain-containing protein n=1 Tax=Mycena indigotica TaxID=2126181 RepID=A0A8H6S1K7_9AGAR|nr:MYND-type domain-containing protein [Mycena indigotica]KAF7290648.1 MYND-type domain-containing protein [Mycena indigotica]